MSNDEGTRLVQLSSNGDRAVSRHRRDEWAITLWSEVHDGRRVAVRLLIEPWSESFGDVEVAKRFMEEQRAWLQEPQSAGVPRISAAMMRNLAVGALLSEQAKALAMGSAKRVPRLRLTPPIPLADMTGDDLVRLNLLLDAVDYADLLAAGDRSPAKTLAERRHVPVRTMQGRIARARDVGLLSGGTAGTASGQLTQQARDLLARAERVSGED